MASSKRGRLQTRAAVGARGSARKAKTTLPDSSPAAASQAERIYAVVRAIPRGKVATYGQLALLAGIAAGHRIAARAMQQCPANLAWYRVLAKKDARRAKVAVADPDHAQIQRKRLATEGVRFDENGFISLRDHGWLPLETAGFAPARKAQASAQKHSKYAGSAPEKQKNR